MNSVYFVAVLFCCELCSTSALVVPGAIGKGTLANSSKPLVSHAKDKYFYEDLLPPADRVSLMIHNAIRVTHGVALLEYSPTLKSTAQMCAEYYASQNMLPAVKPCPLIASSCRPDAAESIYAFDLTMGTVGDSQKIRTAIWTNWYNEPDPNWVAPVYSQTYEAKVQLIWKETTEMACAVSQLSTLPPTAPTRFVVCLYSAPGNTPQTPEAFAANVYPDKF